MFRREMLHRARSQINGALLLKKIRYFLQKKSKFRVYTNTPCAKDKRLPFLNIQTSAFEVAPIWIFSRVQRDGVTAQMKNKFLLFPTISSARYYHTDRSVTFLPATLEANEKSLGWKMQYQTCDLFRGWGGGGLLKTAKHAQIVNQWNWLQWKKCAGGLQTLSEKTSQSTYVSACINFIDFFYFFLLENKASRANTQWK